MKSKTVLVAVTIFTMALLAGPAAAQSVGGPSKPKNVGGPAVHPNLVVAPVRGAAPSAVSTPPKLPPKKT